MMRRMSSMPWMRACVRAALSNGAVTKVTVGTPNASRWMESSKLPDVHEPHLARPLTTPWQPTNRLIISSSAGRDSTGLISR
jgi:hypothetical protein